jgi:hypothetical protein
MVPIRVTYSLGETLNFLYCADVLRRDVILDIDKSMAISYVEAVSQPSHEADPVASARTPVSISNDDRLHP